MYYYLHASQQPVSIHWGEKLTTHNKINGNESWEIAVMHQGNGQSNVETACSEIFNSFENK